MAVCPRCNSTLDEDATQCPQCDGDELVVVFETQREFEASLVAQVLSEIGIRNLKRSAGTEGFLPLVTGRLATIKILVLERDAEAARQALAQLRDENGESDE